MLKRLFAGTIKGIIVGAALALLLVKGLSLTFMPGLIGYLVAAVTGLVVGLVAGRPIWARDAKLEAGLKAVVGAGLAVAALFAFRRWLHFEVDLSLLEAGKGAASELTAASVPLLTTVLAVLFELDNTPAEKSEARASKPARSRVSAPQRSERDKLEEIDDSVDAVEARHSQRR
jgi:tetrahydromethanopterin S-methyltransferase subunit F